MQTFSYRAITTDGSEVNGSYSAEDVYGVESWLIRNGMSPVAINYLSTRGDDSSGSSAPAVIDQGEMSLLTRMRGISIDDRILFCRQLSTMLDAGVPVLKGLQVMTRQVSNPILGNIFQQIADNIEGGKSLSGAFEMHRLFFNKLFINVVKIGEESGSLDRAFSYLAALFENEKDINERIKAATRYPKIVITAITIAVFFLMTFVVPKFVVMFASAAFTLPLPTRVLIALSDFFSNNWIKIALTVAAGIGIYKYAIKFPGIIYLKDRIALKIPIFGNLSTKIYMARFCRVFSVLMESGIDIITTISLSASALDNIFLMAKMQTVGNEVEVGVTFHAALAKQPEFPPMVVQMVAIGEESGQMEDMMRKVADFYDLETDYTIKNLASLIEPILLFFLGIIVGFMALAIFMPMWDMMQVMQH